MKGRAGAAVTFLLSSAMVCLVFFLSPRWLALPLAGMSCVLWFSRRSDRPIDLLASVAMALLAVVVLITDSRLAAMAYPVVINTGLLAYFWSTLRTGPSAIERLARLEEPDLPPEGVAYTRTLTKVWCGFFLLNGLTAAATAVWADPSVWAWYNGVIAYLMIAVLLFGERGLRPLLIARAQPALASHELARVLGEGRPAEELACWQGARRITIAELRADVLAHARGVATSARGEWLVSAEDGYDFTVQLLAVGLSGRHAIVPQNHQTATLRGVAELHPGAEAPTPLREPGQDEWQPTTGGQVTFYTSGSSGKPKAVTRSFDALLKEAQVWESLFGERLGRAEVIGTVPHHFIYGAIFRILWPLWAGRPFDAKPFADCHSLAARLKQGGELVLVSSPSLLQRMPAEEIRTLVGLRAIFTSGSLLEASVAKLWSFPIEVYGSTETGGVAWRRQEIADAPWTPLPGVTLTTQEDGTLHVRSPYVAPGGEQTADLVRLVGQGRFELLGRADRIAKVEGRRVSLAELESLAEAHPAVRRCVMLQSEPHARPQAVLVPEMASDAADYVVVWEEVRQLMLARYDAVVIPRRHRFAPVLPADARGKHTAEALRRLFTPEPSVGGTQSWPRFVGHRRQDGSVTVDLAVPEDLPLFAGHFPGAPILPGVILISWAATCAEAYLGWRGDSTGIDHLKFNAAVWPRETLQLKLSLTPAGGVKFEFQAGGKAKAAGVFRPA
jgi:uncharacterized membrane protein/acyl-CoA synthetase (AMP-forming)/AMP-acid ligase II